MTKKLVVIGAGMASGRMLEHLIAGDPQAYDITLFNAEPRGNYNRLMLSPVLSGEKTYEDIVTHDDDWYAENNVTTRFGEKVVAHYVRCAEWEQEEFDRVVTDWEIARGFERA